MNFSIWIQIFSYLSLVKFNLSCWSPFASHQVIN